MAGHGQPHPTEVPSLQCTPAPVNPLFHQVILAFPGGLLQSLEPLSATGSSFPSLEGQGRGGRGGGGDGGGSHLLEKVALDQPESLENRKEALCKSALERERLQTALSAMACWPARAFKKTQLQGYISASNYPLYLLSNSSSYLSVFIALSRYCVALWG